MEEIRDLSKQIDFNNSIYRYKSKTVPKGPLEFYKHLKEGNILEKAEEEKKIKNELSDILKGRNKTGKQIHAINNIKTLYESHEKVIKLFDDCSRIASKAKYKTKYGEALKIFTPKQMLQRIPIALAQIKAGNTSKNLLNEIREIIYPLYDSNENTKKVYNNIMNSIKV